MSLDKKTKEQLLKGSLKLDFPVITLTPLSPDKHRGTLSGSGYISISDSGFLELTLYCERSLSIKEVFQSFEWKSGEIIEEKYYYNLNATEYGGECWGADRLLPDSSSGPGGTIVTARIRRIIKRSEHPPTKDHPTCYLKIAYPGKIPFPANTSVQTEKKIGDKRVTLERQYRVAGFTAGNVRFEIEADGDATYFAAESDILDFDEKTIHCITDTFAFITGRTMPWTLMDIIKDGVIEIRVQTSPLPKQKSRMERPLVGDRPGEDYWTLFEKYLSYGLKHGDVHRHPFAGLVGAVIDAGKAPLELEALILSASIESLLVNHYPRPQKASEDLKRNIREALEMVDRAAGFDEDFRKRLRGATAALQHPHSSSTLIRLQEENLIEESLVTGYRAFRNKYTHGGNVEGDEFQSFLRQSGAMLVLFYQLIFLKIGYAGKFTDYGASGYPEKRFIALLDENKSTT